MDRARIILEGERFALTIERLCHQLIENYGSFQDTCVIGIQPRGVLLADRIVDRIRELSKDPALLYGKLDISFYRDDFRTRDTPLAVNKTEVDFLVEDRRVILVDDVLYTGRSVQAALTALQHFGRPKQVELVALIDRRFNRHLPIQCNYTGMVVDALDEEYVKVEWSEEGKKDRIKLYSKTEK